LQEGQRIEDTPVHEALREALVNTLIHADFTGRMSVLVVKRPDMFGFRNPGLMRVPPELAVIGGNSDCRNRRLQTMFQLVGYGDHAGSGVPKIYRNWEGRHWRRPALYELREPDQQTLMELRMTSLVPDEVVAELEANLGERFATLSELERLALITATAEGMVNHARLREMSTEHSVDITRMLSNLVREGLLVSDGAGRGMVYFVPWHPADQIALFSGEQALVRPRMDGTKQAQESAGLTQELDSLTQELSPQAQELGLRVWSEVAELPGDLLLTLRALAEPVRSRERASPVVMRAALTAMCAGRYLGVRVLANLLDRRDQADLVRRVLTPMVEEGLLKRAYPRPNDPRQAYISIQADA